MCWAGFRTGDSVCDLFRVLGSGPYPLLLNAGQAGRRGRLWWRLLLDQYGAADVIIPIARLERQWHGGPVIGRFAARYGPDNRLIGTFAARSGRIAGVPAMKTKVVRRINIIYKRTSMEGRLGRHRDHVT